MKWARVGLLVVLCVAAASVLGADKNGKFGIMTLDDRGSCGSFNNAVVAGNTKDDWSILNDFYIFVAGYFTATNVLLADTYDITGGKGKDAYMGWLEKYCAENPLDSFAAALNALVTELYPSRTVDEP